MRGKQYTWRWLRRLQTAHCAVCVETEAPARTWHQVTTFDGRACRAHGRRALLQLNKLECPFYVLPTAPAATVNIVTCRSLAMVDGWLTAISVDWTKLIRAVNYFISRSVCLLIVRAQKRTWLRRKTSRQTDWRGGKTERSVRCRCAPHTKRAIFQHNHTKRSYREDLKIYEGKLAVTRRLRV